MIALIRGRTNDAAEIIASLSDEQLALPVRPSRARAGTIDAFIEAVLIGHYHRHLDEIEAKIDAVSS